MPCPDCNSAYRSCERSQEPHEETKEELAARLRREETLFNEKQEKKKASDKIWAERIPRIKNVVGVMFIAVFVSACVMTTTFLWRFLTEPLCVGFVLTTAILSIAAVASVSMFLKWSW